MVRVADFSGQWIGQFAWVYYSPEEKELTRRYMCVLARLARLACVQILPASLASFLRTTNNTKGGSVVHPQCKSAD